MKHLLDQVRKALISQLINSLSRHETAHVNIVVHDMINLLYYEYGTDKQKYFYVYN